MTDLTIIICPVGGECNFRCAYCFQGDDIHGEKGAPYSFHAIKKSLYEVWQGSYRGSDITLHGGECLLLPMEEIEKLLQLMYEMPLDGGKVRGVSSIMSNGDLITDDLIEIFKKWNTNVGLSVDGPPELNVMRGPDPSDPVITKHYTDRLEKTILKLRNNGISVSIICVINKNNAGTAEILGKLAAWMIKMKKIGITCGRMNPMTDDNHRELELTSFQLYRAWLNIYNWNKQYDMRWNPVVEMEKNLLSGKPSPCSLSMCDPFNTHTLSILPDGMIGNCDRTFGLGTYPRSDMNSTCGRYESLQLTECRDCPRWRICGGGCPMDGVDGDWRHKTRWCEAILKTYQYIEDKLKKEGKTIALPKLDEISLIKAIGGIKNTPHGDTAHGDSSHGDSSHGDAPHGDSSHGDKPDWRKK